MTAAGGTHDASRLAPYKITLHFDARFPPILAQGYLASQPSFVPIAMAAVNAGGVKEAARSLERKAEGSHPASPEKKKSEAEANRFTEGDDEAKADEDMRIEATNGRGDSAARS